MKIAVVGRPNVGKSTLINRFIQKKLAITSEFEGTTRDTSSYNTVWNGVDLEFIDSAGFMPFPEHLDKITMASLEFAVKNSDKVLFLVDGTVSWTDDDVKLSKLVKNYSKNIVFAANKLDDANNIPDYAYNFRTLGLGDPFFISALHGKNIGDLLDLITADYTEKKSDNDDSDMLKIALIGRPNVGKSSLLNKLLKKDRVVVHSDAGTTRDSISEIIQLGEKKYEFIDTAGIKKKLYKVQGPDYYANIRTQQIIDFADICLLLIDSKDISVQDIKLANTISEKGKGIIFIFNKFDLLDDYDLKVFEKTLEKDFLPFLSWVPILKISALSGKNTHRIENKIQFVSTNLKNRISTANVNKFFGEITKKNPPKPIKGKVSKINYASQVSTMPTIFSIWANNKLNENYKRYIINQLRENFDFEGVPIELNIKQKK